MSESREFELQAEIASLRKDAERYRWIKANHYSEGHRTGGGALEVEYIGFKVPDLCDDLDVAIDAAIYDGMDANG